MTPGPSPADAIVAQSDILPSEGVGLHSTTRAGQLADVTERRLVTGEAEADVRTDAPTDQGSTDAAPGDPVPSDAPLAQIERFSSEAEFSETIREEPEWTSPSASVPDPLTDPIPIQAIAELETTDPLPTRAAPLSTLSLPGPPAAPKTLASAASSAPPSPSSLVSPSLDPPASLSPTHTVPVPPTRVTTPTPSPIPSQLPPSSTKPTSANTGVPAGTVLTAIRTDLVIRTPGTIIDSKEVFGAIRVEAANVTIRRSILHGSQTNGQPVVYAGSPSVLNLVIEDVEISPTVRNMYTNGVYGHDFTLTRANIHDVVDSVHVFNGGNVTIENSYLHHNLHFGPEIDRGHPDGSHDDNVQIQDGNNIIIRSSVLSGAYNAAVQITQGRGPISDVTIEGNWVEGGACSVNIAEGRFGKISGVAVTANEFGGSRANCPIILTRETLRISQLHGNRSALGGEVVLICYAPSGNARCG